MLASIAWLVASLFAQDAAEPPPVAGIYQGTLDLGAASLRLAVHLERDAKKGFTATLDSLDQGAFDIPATTVEVKDRHVTLAWAAIGASMEGDLAPNGESLDVRFKQGAVDTPMQLRRVEKIEMPKRPQEPKPPFPYGVEEVTFDSKAKDVELAGTLTTPPGDGPFPAVVLVSGSGPQDRDEALLGHKPFLVLSHHLTKNGIAVLRYDDRGFGQSTGNFATATSFDFADDALGAVALLKTRPRIDPKRIGVAGHSEGGLIAPIVATTSSDVAFIVLLAGPGVPGDRILELQSALIAKAGGATDEDVARAAAINKELYALIKSQPVGPPLAGKLLGVVEEAKKNAKTDEERNAYAQIALGTTQLATPWFKTFLSYDPRTALRKVKCPVLALNGELDLQVPAQEDLREIEKALDEAGNARVTIRSMPGLNHLFQPCKTGSPAEYAQIETTMSEDVLEAVAGFVLRVQ